MKFTASVIVLIALVNISSVLSYGRPLPKKVGGNKLPASTTQKTPTSPSGPQIVNTYLAAALTSDYTRVLGAKEKPDILIIKGVIDFVVDLKPSLLPYAITLLNKLKLAKGNTRTIQENFNAESDKHKAKFDTLREKIIDPLLGAYEAAHIPKRY